MTAFLKKLLPETVWTASDDEARIQAKYNDLSRTVTALDISLEQQADLIKWLTQMKWADDRALREARVYNIIIWWQIFCSFALPVMLVLQDMGVLQDSLVASLLATFLAFITGLQQFRQPGKNSVRYQYLVADYQRELDDFMALAVGKYHQPGVDIPRMNHEAAFAGFNERMTTIRRADVATYFGVKPEQLSDRRG